MSSSKVLVTLTSGFFYSSLFDLTVKEWKIICFLAVLKIIQFVLQSALLVFSYQGTFVKFVYNFCLIICIVVFIANLIACYLQVSNEDWIFKQEKKILITFIPIYLIVIGIISIDVDQFFKNDGNVPSYINMTQEVGLNLNPINSTMDVNFSDEILLNETMDINATAEVQETKSKHDEVISHRDFSYIKVIIIILIVLVIQVIIYIITSNLGSRQSDLETGTVNTDDSSKEISPQSSSNASSAHGKQMTIGNLTHRICKKSDLEDSDSLDEVDSGERRFVPLPKAGSSKKSSEHRCPDKEFISMKDSSSQAAKEKFGKSIKNHCCENFHQLTFPPKKDERSGKTFPRKKDDFSDNFHKLTFSPKKDDHSGGTFSRRKDDPSGNFHELTFPQKKDDRSDFSDKFHKLTLPQKK